MDHNGTKRTKTGEGGCPVVKNKSAKFCIPYPTLEDHNVLSHDNGTVKYSEETRLALFNLATPNLSDHGTFSFIY